MLTVMCFKTFILIIHLMFFVSFMTHGYIIRTENGRIRGLETKLSNNLIMYSYLGIPYARPPVGGLRFEAPQPSPKWGGVKDTTTQKPQCVQSRSASVRTDKIEGSEDCLYLNIYTSTAPQPSPKWGGVKDTTTQKPPCVQSRSASVRTDKIEGSEDCLYLNIYTSTLPNINNNVNYPVMVWIHGGGFYEGDNGYELYPPENFVKQEIVVVTIAYRLGIFGFFHTADLVSPGNNGIKDQILALKWIKENVEYFGGDKNKITISSESAGGMAISHLILTPLSKGLYQRAIIESRSALMTPALGEEKPVFAFKTGSLLGIDTNNSRELVTKLRNVDFRELQAASRRAGVNAGQHLLAYTVVIEPKHENAVVIKSPYEMLENGEFNKVVILMGINSNEGDGLSDTLIKSVLKKSKLDHSNLVPIGLNLDASSDAKIINYVGALIKEYFFPGSTDFNEADFQHGVNAGQHLLAYTVVIEPKHENAVVIKSPYEMLENGEFNKVVILMGINSTEVPIGLNLDASSDAKIINYVGALIKEYSFPDSTDFNEADFQHWYGDMALTRGTIQQGNLLSKHTDVYFYEFNCIGHLGNPLRTNWKLVGHAEELNYLFARRTQPRILSDDDKTCSERVVKLWGNFIKYGNPTPNNEIGIVCQKRLPCQI